MAAGLPVVLQDGTNTYVYGLDLISATDGGGDQTYFLYDGLGSVTDLTDDEGDVVDDYTYDVFGAVRSQSGSSDNYWLFTGEQADSDEGLYHLRARYYDPATGRFLSQDPVPSNNLYAYVRNNPLTFMDPTGQWPKIKVPNPVEEVKKKIVDPVVDTAEDAAKKASDFFTETVPNAAECTWDQMAGAGDWLYRNAVVPVVEFLGSCEGKLLAAGVFFVGAGASGVGLYVWSARAALAAPVVMEGAHGASHLGWVLGAGGVVGSVGLAGISDACFGTSHWPSTQRAEAAGDNRKE